jgi:hypothetical protein
MRKQGSTENYILLNKFWLGEQIKKNEICGAFGMYVVLVGKPGGIYMNCTGRAIIVKVTS